MNIINSGNPMEKKAGSYVENDLFILIYGEEKLKLRSTEKEGTSHLA